MPCQFGVPKGLMVSNPTGFLDPVAGGRRRSIVKNGIRITRAANDGAAHNFNFSVKNPSDRLRCTVQVQIESDSGSDLTIANVTWQLRAMAVNAQSGRRSPMQLIYGPSNAPDGYELDSGVMEMLGTVFLPTTAAFGFAVGDACNIVIQCSWEPNENVSEDELRDLLAGASLTIDGAPLATTYL